MTESEMFLAAGSLLMLHAACTTSNGFGRAWAFAAAVWLGVAWVGG